MPAMAPPERLLLEETGAGAGAGVGARVGAGAEPLMHGQLPNTLRLVLLSCDRLMVRFVLGGTEHDGELNCVAGRVGAVIPRGAHYCTCKLLRQHSRHDALFVSDKPSDAATCEMSCPG